MSARAAFRQSDITRAIRGANAAGVQVERLEVDTTTGKIVVVPKGGGSPTIANEWDEVLPK